MYEEMNVKQKLIKARLAFLNEKVTKSGKHMKLEFKYFELEDIVPPAIRIFNRYGLVHNTVFTRESATMYIHNVDGDEEPLTFSVPWTDSEQIVSREGKSVTNPLQAEGSTITYLRRYLWMMALDITEPDSVDPATEVEEEEEVVPKPRKKREPKPPATIEERAEAKKELTAEEPATMQDIDALKTCCKKLLALDENQEDFVQTIAMKTNGFTEISKSACIALCNNLVEMIQAYGNPD